jgi:Zn-dependent protease
MRHVAIGARALDPSIPHSPGNRAATLAAVDRHQQTSWLPPVAYEPAPAPAPPPKPQRGGWRRYATPLFFGFLAILKWGKALVLLLPKAKVLTTSASMLVSVGAYALIWGWRFAAGFVALLFIHEMGHYIQLRREGVRPSSMVFIPFLGAAVSARSLGGSALAEARVGLAGPVLGSLATAALVPIAIATDDDFWRALAFTGFFLNLFNLLPVVPLDGGRAMAAMAPWMWFAGFGGLVVLLFLWPNPILVIIVLLGGYETYRRWKHRKQGLDGNADYYRVKPLHRALVAVVYIGLVVGLAAGMDAMHVERTFDDV